MSSTKQLHSNNASTTVAVQVTASDTVITVADASKFNNPAATGRYILITLENSGVIEIVKVSNISGNVFSVYGGISGRGQEGTTASSFPVGTLVEARTTANTLANFITTQTYLPYLSSADGLSLPSTMDGIAYMAGLDDGGSAVLAYALSTTQWNFPSYQVAVTGNAVSGSTTSAVIGTTLTYAAGKYIIQFTSGANQGSCRAITGIAGTTISWATPTGTAVSTDGYQIFQSNYSVVNGLSAGTVADDALVNALVFSD